MGPLRLARLAAATCCLLASFAGSTAHAADRVQPRSAEAFRDSVGVSTHIVYYSTPYGNWPLLVDRLQELGIRHLRDGTYANPGPQWRSWNERYYQAVEYAADHGLRFNFGLGNPGYQAGTLDQLIDVVAGRLRRAAEAVEGPNEFDKYVGGRRWRIKLAAYSRELYRKSRHPSLRGLPVVGPSLAAPRGRPRSATRAPGSIAATSTRTRAARPAAVLDRRGPCSHGGDLRRRPGVGHGGRLPQRGARQERHAADLRVGCGGLRPANGPRALRAASRAPTSTS